MILYEMTSGEIISLAIGLILIIIILVYANSKSNFGSIDNTSTDGNDFKSLDSISRGTRGASYDCKSIYGEAKCASNVARNAYVPRISIPSWTPFVGIGGR
jgi:hypothetical protein